MQNHSFCQRYLFIASLVLACFIVNGFVCHAAIKTLHFEGNVEDAGGPNTTAACTGNGANDIVICDGPIMTEIPTLSTATAASWTATSGLDGTNPRTIYDPTWVWTTPTPVTIKGNIVVSWWASCNACTTRAAAGEATWDIRLYTNTAAGALPVFTKTISATPATPNVPSLLTATIALPGSIDVPTVLEIVIDPLSVTSQANTRIYYDSTLPCPGVAALTTPCDSTLQIDTATTAAQSTIRGRITNNAGRGLANVNVFLNAANGSHQSTARTDMRGFYVIENVPTGTEYLIYVRRKGYRFSPDNQVLSFNEEQSNVDFVGGLK